LESVVQHPAGILVLVFVSQLLWLLGIHGGLVIAPLRNPLFVAALAANIAAVEAGLQPTNAVTFGYWFVFCGIGGAGCTLALNIAIFMGSKREEHRSVSKFSLLPGLFGVSEPLVFGLPVVLNPVMAIPFVVAGMIAAGLPLIATSIGFIPAPIVDVPVGVPIVLNALICYQTFNAVILQFIILAVCTFVYLPFVYMLNRPTAEELVKGNS
jgi:PTS system cellobiose-specific IIC component